MHLAISSIRLDGGTQPRAEIDRTIVAAYAEAIRSGDTFPRPTVFFDGTDHWLADGFHRVHAHRETGATEIDCNVLQGTRRDAVLHSVGSNADHGLRRTNADKRRAIETLLRDEEWSKRSDSWIGTHCKVDHKTVARVRGDLGIPKSSKVEGRDGRTIDVTSIGQGKANLPEALSLGNGGRFATISEWPIASFDDAVAYARDVIRQLRTASHHEDCLAALDAYAAFKNRQTEILDSVTVPGDFVASARQLYVFADVRDGVQSDKGLLFDALFASVDCARRGKAAFDRELAVMDPWQREAVTALAVLPAELRDAVCERRIAELEGVPADEAKARCDARVAAFYAAQEAAE